MPRQGYKSKRVLNFGGPSKNALQSKNMRYFYVEDGSTGIPYCKVRTRAGHSVAFNPASAVKSMYNFTATDPILSAPLNWLLFYTGAEAKIYDIINDVESSMSPAISIGAPAVKLSVAEAGTRAYFSSYDVNGIGASKGYVVNTDMEADQLFAPPPISPTIALTPLAVASGDVTAGDHNLAIVMTTRSGFSTRPGPETVGGLLVPASIAVVAGNYIQLTAGGTWPAEADSIAVIMTATDDPSTYYFVAGATAAVVPGVFSVSIIVNVDDAALLNSPPAADYFNKLTASTSGNAPFAPSFVLAYKNRMVYGAGDRVYISDNFDYQTISADQHVQYLPGLQQIIGGFQYRDGTLHLLSHDATYSLSDSGDVPVNWAGPQLVDGRIGTSAPNGMTRDSSKSYVWVATPSSLRLFADGTYEDPPISFWVPDWDRINWAAAATLEILEDVDNQTVMVLAALDVATSPSHVLVFDYKAGKTPDKVKFALNTAPGRFCMARVIDPSTGKGQAWFGPESAGKVWYQDKSATLDEADAIIGQVYETARLLDASEVTGQSSFHGVRLTTRGTASLSLTPYGPEHTKSLPPRIINLAQLDAGDRPLRQWRMNADNQSIEFSADSGWFELAEAEVFYTLWIGQR